MNIIEGTRVDIIEPFPLNQLGRLWGWSKATKSIAVLDGSPTTEVDFVEHMKMALPYVRSFGVIDKYNEINAKHEAPMVGFLMFEPSPPCSFYGHVASSRRVWASGLMEEAAKLAFAHIFATEPGLQRISACIPATNKAARSFTQRIGMHKDGYFKNAGLVKGNPISMAHYGYIRPVVAPDAPPEEVEAPDVEPIITEGEQVSDVPFSGDGEPLMETEARFPEE